MAEWREVEVAIVTGKGLAPPRRAIAHRTQGAGLVVLRVKDGKYSVTHVASGKAITIVRTLLLAKRLLLAIAPLACWTDNEDRLRKQRGLGARVSDAINAATEARAVA
jgi:hypothetical protein